MEDKILNALMELERRIIKRMDVGFSQVRQDIENVRALLVTAQDRHIETRVDLADVVRRLGAVEEQLGLKRRQ